MSEPKNVKVDANVSLGSLWIAGWLFTIGFVGLSFWQGVLALFIWPYFLGVEAAADEARAIPAIEREER